MRWLAPGLPWPGPHSKGRRPAILVGRGSLPTGHPRRRNGRRSRWSIRLGLRVVVVDRGWAGYDRGAFRGGQAAYQTKKREPGIRHAAYAPRAANTASCRFHDCCQATPRGKPPGNSACARLRSTEAARVQFSTYLQRQSYLGLRGSHRFRGRRRRQKSFPHLALLFSQSSKDIGMPGHCQAGGRGPRPLLHLRKPAQSHPADVRTGTPRQRPRAVVLRPRFLRGALNRREPQKSPLRVGLPFCLPSAHLGMRISEAQGVFRKAVSTVPGRMLATTRPGCAPSVMPGLQESFLAFSFQAGRPL